jgi:hypothetical protein
MTVSPPQANGTKPAMPVFGEWRSVTQDTGPVEPAGPAVDPIAEAEADAIRARSYAESEARRIAAQAEADAIRAKAEAEAERQRLVNERTEMRQEKERAEHVARLAEINRKREEAERATREANAKAEAEELAEAEQEQAEETAAGRWRNAAIGFAIACGIVALPVQISAFWNPEAWWLVAAPVFLEGGAWVVLAGAAAAVVAHRPHWHYRLIAWLLAAVAAAVNLWHGLNAFDTATAVATAFASLAGPGVWDLHEHGRIRKRDGALSRRERKEQRAADKKAAAAKARIEATARAEKDAAEKAVAEAAQQLAETRAKEFPKVWDHARKLAAALGETTVTEPVWRRAHKDIEGTDPGDSVDIIRGRNIAARRVEAARSEAPGNTPSKVTSTQRAIQVKAPRRQSSYRPTPPRRTKNDTPKFHPVARALAADAKRQSNTSTEEQS